MTLNIFLFSPLTISFTTPLTGLQYFIESFSLSKNNGSPAKTLSPILTHSLGINKLKSIEIN